MHDAVCEELSQEEELNITLAYDGLRIGRWYAGALSYNTHARTNRHTRARARARHFSETFTTRLNFAEQT